MEEILSAFQFAIKKTLPEICVKKALKVDADNFLIFEDRSYPLHKNVHLVAFGKAAVGMVAGAESALKDHFVGGIASIPNGIQIPSFLKTKFLKGAENNLMDLDSLQNTQKIREYLNELKGKEQLVIFLISGGGSALLCAPVDGINLAEKLSLIKLMTSNGADITQLNIVRGALSNVKRGKLIQNLDNITMISLILSDIIADPIDLISSGPTVPITNVRESPIEILESLKLKEKVSEKIFEILRKKNPENDDFKNIDIQNQIIANNRMFLEELKVYFGENRSDLDVEIVSAELQGNASEIGVNIADFFRQILSDSDLNLNLKNLLDKLNISKVIQLNNKKPTILLFGGETTVTFPTCGRVSGKGGRNQELVLAAFSRLCDSNELWEGGRKFALFSLGTDGQDGPTDAAGAGFQSLDVITSLRMNSSRIHTFLQEKNSYGFWSEFNDGKNLIKTGKTGTNFMDILIVYLE